MLGSTFDKAQMLNSHQMIADLISEYTDALAGSFLRHLLPPDQTFEIALPRFSTLADQNIALPVEGKKMGITFQVENHPVIYLANCRNQR